MTAPALQDYWVLCAEVQEQQSFGHFSWQTVAVLQDCNHFPPFFRCMLQFSMHIFRAATTRATCCLAALKFERGSRNHSDLPTCQVPCRPLPTTREVLPLRSGMPPRPLDISAFEKCGSWVFGLWEVTLGCLWHLPWPRRCGWRQ